MARSVNSFPFYHVHENHNSLGREQPLSLDVKQSPNVQDAFWPIPGLISCAGVTGSVGITCHARATQMAGLKSGLRYMYITPWLNIPF